MPLEPPASAGSGPRAEHGVYLPALDGIRAFAVLLVIPHNVNVLTDPLPGFAYLWGKYVQFGWAGVQLFFVLSGFLISRALLESRESPNYYSAFFGRRVLRIFPLYYATLIIILILWPLLPSAGEAVSEPAAKQFFYWTFLANWTSPLGGDIKGISHFWSLAVEEQFYLLWPFVVHRRTPGALLRICASLVVLALGFRILLAYIGASPECSYEFTCCRMDALAAGSAVAILHSDPRWKAVLQRHQATLLWSAGGALALGELTTRAFYREGLATLTYGHVLLDFAFAALVAAAAIGVAGRARWFAASLSVSPLRAIGKYSYGMYVIHYPLNRYLTRPWMEARHVSYSAGIAYACAMVAVSFGLAYVSYHVFEKRFLALKRYFRPRAPSLEPQAAPLG
jgi:peptidoglycan/LPS O-acetylase OafA/YrhL